MPAEPTSADWDDLARLLGRGALADLFTAPVTPPADWRNVFDMAGFQMVLSRPTWTPAAQGTAADRGASNTTGRGAASALNREAASAIGREADSQAECATERRAERGTGSATECGADPTAHRANSVADGTTDRGADPTTLRPNRETDGTTDRTTDSEAEPRADRAKDRGAGRRADPTLDRGADFAVAELGRADVPDMLALIDATRPGPFWPRTIELGAFYGVRDNGALLTMAGERLRPPGWTEISSVCTAPQARGRGLAAQVVRAAADRITARGERPFLHVVDTNLDAIRLYERLGFVVRTRVRFHGYRVP
ncbi:GNAT family N-acetyltransferase [Dactylosporangium sp. McL0621]|uniref:GNAT family N-acetyltransferase n=1 Tax=Dactylosporangium sp. McL0621 TaxID=3415678 RepID=UPI003CFB18F7